MEPIKPHAIPVLFVRLISKTIYISYIYIYPICIYMSLPVLFHIYYLCFYGISPVMLVHG